MLAKRSDTETKVKEAAAALAGNKVEDESETSECVGPCFAVVPLLLLWITSWILSWRTLASMPPTLSDQLACFVSKFLAYFSLLGKLLIFAL